VLVSASVCSSAPETPARMPPAKSFISTSTIAFCDAEPHSGFAAGQLLGFSAEHFSNADVFFFAHSFALAHKQAWKKYLASWISACQLRWSGVHEGRLMSLHTRVVLLHTYTHAPCSSSEMCAGCRFFVWFLCAIEPSSCKAGTFSLAQLKMGYPSMAKAYLKEYYAKLLDNDDAKHQISNVRGI
jgi:hypothetical protein